MCIQNICEPINKFEEVVSENDGSKSDAEPLSFEIELYSAPTFAKSLLVLVVKYS